MTDLSLLDFAGALLVMRRHQISAANVLRELSAFDAQSPHHVYRSASPSWALYIAAGLVNCHPVAGARRFSFYTLNERGRTFRQRLQKLEAQRALRRNQRTAVLRAMQEDADTLNDWRAGVSEQRYAGAL